MVSFGAFIKVDCMFVQGFPSAMIMWVILLSFGQLCCAPQINNCSLSLTRTHTHKYMCNIYVYVSSHIHILYMHQAPHLLCQEYIILVSLTHECGQYFVK